MRLRSPVIFLYLGLKPLFTTPYLRPWLGYDHRRSRVHAERARCEVRIIRRRMIVRRTGLAFFSSRESSIHPIFIRRVVPLSVHSHEDVAQTNRDVLPPEITSKRHDSLPRSRPQFIRRADSSTVFSVFSMIFFGCFRSFRPYNTLSLYH